MREERYYSRSIVRDQKALLRFTPPPPDLSFLLFRWKQFALYQTRQYERQDQKLYRTMMTFHEYLIMKVSARGMAIILRWDEHTNCSLGEKSWQMILSLRFQVEARFLV